MPDVLLFGATGYTGRFTAHALARRGASFVVAGRNRDKLEELASATGAAGVAVAEVGDVEGLARAASEARVLLTCVGPFTSMGRTAAEAAIAARVNYLDSTGEGPFIERLIEGCDGSARDAGIAMAPALGLEEVVPDLAVTLATEGLETPEVVITYASNAKASWGTLRSAIQILVSPDGGPSDGSPPSHLKVGGEQRWAPMPPPLGPSAAISFPMAEAHLAPLHLNLRSLQLFVVAGALQCAGLRYFTPLLQAAGAVPGIPGAMNGVLARFSGGPDESHRASAVWTILAEAEANGRRRNVVVSGRDPYGLTAELLATGAIEMSRPGYDRIGVLSPVQAVPLETWRTELARNDVTIEVIES
jgi:short subunit dehydrogenase-like uncharacterized protein